MTINSQDLTGQTFGRWVVIKRDDTPNKFVGKTLEEALSA